MWRRAFTWNKLDLICWIYWFFFFWTQQDHFVFPCSKQTISFADTIIAIYCSFECFPVSTGSLLIFKSFNLYMQFTLSLATLHWIRNFWKHWLIDDTVDLMSVELFWYSHSKTVFSEIGPSRSVFSLPRLAFQKLIVSPMWNKNFATEKTNIKGQYLNVVLSY